MGTYHRAILNGSGRHGDAGVGLLEHLPGRDVDVVEVAQLRRFIHDRDREAALPLKNRVAGLGAAAVDNGLHGRVGVGAPEVVRGVGFDGLIGKLVQVVHGRNAGLTAVVARIMRRQRGSPAR